MKLREFFYLIWYSFRSLFEDLGDLLNSLKKPATWSYMLFAAFGLSIYYQKYDLLKYILPAILLIKLLRDKIDQGYRKDLFERDIVKGKTTKIVLDYYESYKKKQKITRYHALPFEEWKVQQLLEKKNK